MSNPVQAVDTKQANSISEISSVRKAAVQSKPDAETSSSKSLPRDTVKISIASQILALKERGASAPEIAAKLGLSVTDVAAELAATASNTPSGSSVLAALSGKRAAAQINRLPAQS